MEITGQILNGHVVVDDSIQLPEGCRVTILVGEPRPETSRNMTLEQQQRYLGALHAIDTVANENPGDDFSGKNHDSVLYGDGS